MRNINRILWMLVTALIFTCCNKDDNTFNSNVSAIKTIFSPSNDYSIDLGQSSSLLFEWDQARAADGGIVLYTLAFAQPDGDFAKPVYTISSDQNGLLNKATLTKETLNKIAKLAGAKPLETATLKWTVYSTKGDHLVAADSSRMITITRPPGLDNPPANLYLTGTATEGGTDISKAVQFKQTDGGKFELYTSLKPGTYHLIDKKTGEDVQTYFIKDGLVREGSDETTVGAGATKIYRITLDLSVLSAKFVEIKELGLWFAPNNTLQFKLNYDKNGTWVANNELITFKVESWGGDERYKFRMQVNDGSKDAYEYWGSINGDNNRPTSSTPASFYYLYPAPNNQWDNCYKFMTEADKAHCDFVVSFASDIDHYTHKVTIK